MEKLIITAAVTGSGPMKENNPKVPYSPQEIADEIVRSWEAGASITHVHVRDPETGEASFEMEYFQNVRDLVRPRCDILLNFTTSSFNLTGDNILEQRVGPIALDPDLCTLDIASMNIRNRVFINPPEWGPFCLKAAKERNVKPELECFEIGHIGLFINLIQDGLIEPPYLFQLCMGTAGGIGASNKNFLNMVEGLPGQDVVWSALGIGRHQFPTAVMAIINGGHVRVGFEDNIYLSKGVLADGNADLVGKVVRLAKELGRDIATPDDARKILKIQKK
jgi:3-keto-5-aminohexanoate cleavage enzyme